VKDRPSLLLINPPLWDFSAFDLWAKPLGLLYLAATLRANGYRVHWLDALDPSSPQTHDLFPVSPRNRYGTGKYFRQRLARPPALKEIPRYYYRFGVPPRLLRKALLAIPEPQAVLVTSLMTYWYPGVQEAVSLVKEVFPRTPLILGGLYACLLPDHAQARTGVDYLITGEGEGAILKLLKGLDGLTPVNTPDPEDLGTYPFPAFDLYPQLPYVCLLTARGCPGTCPYCASRLLQPRFRERSPENIVEEIRHWHQGYGVRDFVFYDDALLIHFGQRMGPVLERVIREGWDLRFHAPNALQVREIDAPRARLLYRAGFKTLRLGVETTNWERQEAWGGKVDPESLERAVRALKESGFTGEQIGVYLLAGLPGQTLEEIAGSIREIKKMGLRPRLAEYSPIPGTSLWPEACAVSRFPLAEEPLYHNNSLFPCLDPFSWDQVQRLKDLARE
jgi:radical SAM superfamily enzyme YgiQ (UPF0313 family)